MKGFSASMATPSMAKIGRQLGGGGSATLEKVGMDLSSAQQQSTQPKLADGGGNGGAGGGVKNGGGGGDGDEGDDDDYYDEGDDEVRSAITRPRSPPPFTPQAIKTCYPPRLPASFPIQLCI